MKNRRATAAPVPKTGRHLGGLEPLDELMTAFVTEHGVPGASLSVTREGRLIYARGFGYAEIEREQAVTPRSLFRLASVSKPITAVAILKLAEHNRLRLEDSVFSLLESLPGLTAREPVAHLKEVTVLNLLQHRGGFDRELSFDPMFRLTEIARAMRCQSPAGKDDIIRYMFSRPLDFRPGERFSYSNFGYCLLGRIVETVSAQSYETYVVNEILAPIGVKNMKLGKTLPEGRADGEVVYYDEMKRKGAAVLGPRMGKRVPLPYGSWCLEVMDAHGGWIASTVDAVRFASAFDSGSDGKILHADSIKAMFARPKGDSGLDYHYGCGWNVRIIDASHFNSWHAGALDGTSTLLVRRFDGFNWAVFSNTRRSKNGMDLAGVIDTAVHQAVDRVQKFPDVDLFEEEIEQPI